MHSWLLDCANLPYEQNQATIGILWIVNTSKKNLEIEIFRYIRPVLQKRICVNDKVKYVSVKNPSILHLRLFAIVYFRYLNSLCNVKILKWHIQEYLMEEVFRGVYTPFSKFLKSKFSLEVTKKIFEAHDQIYAGYILR